jgi:hypothetical protein
MILVEEQTRIASSEVIAPHSPRSVVEKLDIDASPPPGLALESFMRDRLAPVLAEGPVNEERGEEPDLESVYELHHLVAARH